MFEFDELRDSIREPFVGLVVSFVKNCDCEYCQRGLEALAEQNKEVSGDRLHIVIKPLEKYEKFQHVWLYMAKTKWSAYGAFVAALNFNVGFKPKSRDPEKRFEEAKKFMEGNAFLWDSVVPAEFLEEITGQPVPKNAPSNFRESKRELWIPQKKMTPKELETLGITDLKTVFKAAVKEWKDYLKEIRSGNEEVEDDFLSLS